MVNFFWVFIGGGLGSACRYGIARIFSNIHLEFPLATMIANVLSCFILGLLLAATWKQGIEQTVKILLISGFCGGFSTFSTFTGETFLLFQNGHFGQAFINVGGSLILCLLALYGGMKIIT